MPRHERHVGELCSGAGDEDEVDGDEVLADDPQTGDSGEGILRCRDAAVDRVLDRDHRGVRPAFDDVGERFTHVVHRNPLVPARLGDLRESRFGERAGRPEEAVGAADGSRGGWGGGCHEHSA